MTGAAAAELGLGRTRFCELYADYLRACARRQAHRWKPRVSGGNHAAPWPPTVEPLLRKLLAARPPAGYSLAASEVRRRLDLQIDPATVRRFALANGLAPSKPAPKPRAAVRRWQCSKIGALPAPSGAALRAKAPPFGYLAPLDSGSPSAGSGP